MTRRVHGALVVTMALVTALILIGTATFIAKRKPDIPMSMLKAKYGDASSRYVNLRAGITLHYREHGRRRGPAVLFIHGLGGSSLSWKSWERTLAKDYHLYQIDLPGHGLTVAPDDWRPSPEAYAKTVEQFARSQRLGRFALVGASFGGQVAWTYAVRYPGRVADLVLISSSGWAEEHPPRVFALLRQPWIIPLLAQIDTTPLFKKALTSTYSDPSKVTHAMVKRFADFSQAPGHRAIIFRTTGSLPLFEPATPQVLAKIAAPTLILHGLRDTRVPSRDAQRFHRAIAQSKLVIYPNASHALADEFAGTAATDTLRFFAANPQF
jgi:pimeloyl-ACP methyl ester carboxylesterase